jgi:hypothetical protein
MENRHLYVTNYTTENRILQVSNFNIFTEYLTYFIFRTYFYGWLASIPVAIFPLFFQKTKKQ